MDRRSAGQAQIELAIGVMLTARGMKLDTPLTWREDADHDTYTLEAQISGHYCHWRLVAEAVENYMNDLNVRYSINYNLQTYFIPR